MKLGLFLPTASNGFLVSTTSPRFDPTFDGLLDVCMRAERFGMDFALSMVKLHGFGGPSGYWNASLDSFTLIAGLVARTRTLKLYASAPILALPPAMAARATSTIDSIDPGRFGINIVTGWQKAEYDSMGMWPGEAHYARRYDYAAEYVTILRELMETGASSFKGEFFEYEDCNVLPVPRAPIDIVCAGQSGAGMRFAAQHGDFSFVPANGINTPHSIGPTLDRLNEISCEVGRPVGAYPLVMICAAETRAEAEERWSAYEAGIDWTALGWASGQANLDAVSASSSESSVARTARGTDIAMTLGSLIGSYAEVAAMLDELAAMPGVSGIMIAVDDWARGLDDLGQRIVPAMRTRA